MIGSVCELARPGQGRGRGGVSSHRILRGILSVVAACLSTATLAADEAMPERVSRTLETGSFIWPPYTLGEFSTDVYNDTTVEADDNDEEINDLFTDSSLILYTFFSPRVLLETKLVVETGQDRDPGENRYFNDHVLRASLLALTYNADNWWVSGGKGGLNFGISRNDAAGIYGADITNDNTRLGGIGVSGQGSIHALSGFHSIYLGVFRRDRSALSEPLLGSGSRTQKSDGGAANTDGFESWVLAVDGSGFSAMPSFRYHLAYASLDTDRINDPTGNALPDSALGDDRRLAVAGEWRNLQVTDYLTVTLLLEYLDFEDARGLSGRDEQFVTGSLSFARGRWTLDVAATGWDIEAPGEPDEDIYQAQLSGGYLFSNGIGLDIGYRYLEEDNDESHTVGLQFSYSLPTAL